MNLNTLNPNNLLKNSQSNNMLKLNFGLAGPNLKCIGAAYTIDKAERDLERDIPALRKSAETVLNVDINYFAKAVNKWIDLFYNTQTANRTWLNYSLNQPPLGCTRDGLTLLINTLDNTKREILASMKKEAIKKGGQLIIDRTEPVEYNVSGGNNLMHPAVERFKILIEMKPEVVSVPQVTNEPVPLTQTMNPDKVATNQITSEIDKQLLTGASSGKPVATEENDTKSGMTPILWVGIAASLLFLGKKSGLI